MLRWLIAVALVGMAGWAFVIAQREVDPRGMRVRVYDNPRWEGSPTSDSVSRHMNYGADFAPNSFTLGEMSSLQMDGWLYAPRSGQYELAVESGSAVWMRVDGRTVVTHRRDRPSTKATLSLDKGVHSLRIDVQHRRGASFLRVQWKLPSGYMKLEAMPPVFVRPNLADDPRVADQVAPSTGPRLPLSHRIGPPVLLLLGLLVAAGPAVTRRLLRLRDAGSRRRFFVGVAVFTCALGVRLVDVDGAGETSDEWAYAGAGRIYITNMVHGYWDSLYWNTNQEHPPIGKYLYGVVSHLAGTDSYTPLRMTAAVLGALTVLLAWRLGLRHLGARAAWLGALTLALLPPFVAHGKVAALDAPSAFLAALSGFLFVRSFDFEAAHAGLAALRDDRGERSRRNTYLLGAAAVASLAFCTKFSNVLVFVFMVLVLVVDQWDTIRRRGVIEVSLSVYALPILPFVFLVAFWPWLWQDPFAQLVKTLTHWDYPIQEWFLGSFRKPAFYYYPVYLFATTPVLLLVPAVAYAVHAVRHPSRFGLILWLWFLTPFLWTLSTLKQDGIRYIYNVYPAFGLIVGAGLDRMLDRSRWRAARAASVVTATATVMLTAYLGWQAARVHPYYLDYYSEAVGGTKGAFDRSTFEVGWWGEGLDRAVDFLNSNAPRGATWDCQGVVTHTFDGLRRDLVHRTRDPDFLVQSYLTPNDLRREGAVERFRVLAAGAPIVVVWERVRPEPQPPPAEPAHASPRRASELEWRQERIDTLDLPLIGPPELPRE